MQASLLSRRCLHRRAGPIDDGDIVATRACLHDNGSRPQRWRRSACGPFNVATEVAMGRRYKPLQHEREIFERQALKSQLVTRTFSRLSHL